MVVFGFVGMLMHKPGRFDLKAHGLSGWTLSANVVSEFFGFVPHSPKSVDPIGNWKL